MRKQPLDRLGQLQRAVIETIWEHGEATVRQVWRRLSQDRELAYTTVLTAMQRLEQAGWLRHRLEGKKNVYTPTRTRQQAGIKSVRTFIKQMYEGSSYLMFQHLIDEGDLSDEELKKLRKLIDSRRKEKQK